jgi:ELWxxDGT repeat protein
MAAIWWRRLSDRFPSTVVAPRRRRAGPRCEILEDRTLLTAYLVADVNPAPRVGSYPADVTNVNGMVFFTANDGSHGRELWRSDGTAAGTQLVKDVNPGPGSGLSGSFADPGASGGTLSGWASDLTDAGGTLYFLANDGNPADGTVQLWKSNSTWASTVLVKGFNPSNLTGGGGAVPAPLGQITPVDGKVYFVMNDGTRGEELWTTDGTAAGTRLVKDINPGGAGSDPSGLVAVGNTLYFFATDSNGTELWKTNGSDLGTVPLKTVSGADPVAVGNTLYFLVSDPTTGVALWKSDGPIPGTAPVKSLGVGTTLSDPLRAVNGRLYFGATRNTSGPAVTQLWTSDGTAGGTVALASFPPTAKPAAPALGNFTGLGSTLFFSANDGTHGNQLWKSDGTVAGTRMVLAINPKGGSDPSDFAAIGNILFFAADDGSHGRELWCSDGTAAGTFLYQKIRFQPHTGSSPHELTNVNGKLFFAAADGVHGDELWADRRGNPTGGTSLTLTASPTDVSAGQPVTLTATVRPGQGSVDGGSVTFKDGNTELGTVAVDGNGVAVLSPVLGAGAHSITADYSGDDNFTASASSAVPITVTSAGTVSTTTGLTASATSVTQGQLVTFTATVTPSQGSLDGGTVDFTDGSVDLGSVTVDAHGGATLGVVFTAGTHHVTATYSGDATFGGSSSSALAVTAGQGTATTTNLAASAASAPQGQPLTFTATVAAGQVAANGGSVDFTDGSTDLGSVAVGAGGLATLSATLPEGVQNVVATYSGDAQLAGSTSAAVAVTITGSAATTTTLTAAPGSVVQGQAITFTATVSPAHGTVDGGTVDFLDGSTDLGMVAVDATGAATLTAILAAGQHSVTAVYSGDATFAGSTSSAVTVTVTQPQGAVDTMTSLTASASSVPDGQPVTFTATVTPAHGVLDGGSVDFTDGSTDLGTVAVGAGGQASLSVALAVGTHHVTAVYLGDANFNGSTSGAVTVTVTSGIDTTTALSVSATSVGAGEPVTFTATVSSALGSVDGGSVDFRDGQTDLGSVSVDGNGVATLTATLPIGPHDVNAVYSGDAAFNGSTSPSVHVAVHPVFSPAEGRVTLTASSTSLSDGQPVTFTATVDQIAGGSLPPGGGGSLTFMDGGTALASVPVDLATGTAVLTTTLGPGVHSITAVFSSDAGMRGVPSAPVIVMVAGPVPVIGNITPLVVLPPWVPPHRRGRNDRFTWRLTFRNASGQLLKGPFRVVLHGLRGNVVLRGADGRRARRGNRGPFVVLDPEGGTLQPNDSLTATLQFSGRPNRFQVSIFAGPLGM